MTSRHPELGEGSLTATTTQRRRGRRHPRHHCIRLLPHILLRGSGTVVGHAAATGAVAVVVVAVVGVGVGIGVITRSRSRSRRRCHRRRRRRSCCYFYRYCHRHQHHHQHDGDGGYDYDVGEVDRSLLMCADLGLHHGAYAPCTSHWHPQGFFAAHGVKGSYR